MAFTLDAVSVRYYHGHHRPNGRHHNGYPLECVSAGIDRAEAVAVVYELLEGVGIPEKLHERTDRLSGGQMQRVAIARALFQHPIALLADEPVSSVDPTRARDAVQLLARLCRQRGITLCACLHNLDLARDYFPRLIGLRHGRVQFDRPTAD